jgi:hypothetical protein
MHADQLPSAIRFWPGHRVDNQEMLHADQPAGAGERSGCLRTARGGICGQRRGRPVIPLSVDRLLPPHRPGGSHDVRPPRGHRGRRHPGAGGRTRAVAELR